MDQLLKTIDSCEVGSSLDGRDLKQQIDLPLSVIRAAFLIFESKGFGICPKTIGMVEYIPIA